MRKVLAVMLFVVLSFSGTAVVSADENSGITVLVNGVAVEFFSSHPPQIVNGRTFVPFDASIRQLGFYPRPVRYVDLRYEPEAHIGFARFESADIKFVFRVGSNDVIVRTFGPTTDTVVQTDIAPFRFGGEEYGTIMLPLRFIMETAGHTINWDSNTRTITITKWWNEQ